MKRLGYFFDDLDLLFQRKLLYHLFQILALHKLHRDERLSFIFSDFVYLADVGMIDARLGSGFPEMPGSKFRIVDLEQFEYDLPIQHRVVRAVNFCGSAFT